jgi:hypothetical protein
MAGTHNTHNTHHLPGEGGGVPPTGRDLIEWLERRLGRSLADIRIHDTALAGQLAARLGARAFTVGRDIYVRPELLRPVTPEGAALLAHEVVHALQQSGAADLPMPLLRPGTPTGPRSAQAGQVAREGASVPVQRQPAGGAGSLPIQRWAAGQPQRELVAEAVEAAALQRRADAGPQVQIDPEMLADRVYRLMVRELQLDGERGMYAV